MTTSPSNLLPSDEAREKARRALLGLPEEEAKEVSPSPEPSDPAPIPPHVETPVLKAPKPDQETEIAFLKKEEERLLSLIKAGSNEGIDFYRKSPPQEKRAISPAEKTPDPKTEDSQEVTLEELIHEKIESQAVEEVPKTLPRSDFFSSPDIAKKENGDKYREKVSLSDYEALKAMPIQVSEKRDLTKKDVQEGESAAKKIETAREKIAESNNPTLASIAAQALDKRAKEKEAEALTIKKQKNKRVLIIILLFFSIVFCSAVLIKVVLENNENSTLDQENTGSVAQNPSSTQDLAALISSSPELRPLTLRFNDERTTRPYSVSEALSVAGLTPPNLVLQALDGYYVIGGSDKGAFIVLGIRSYEYAFAGMLAWEDALPSEFSGLTPSVAASFFVEFKDETENNIDMRVGNQSEESGSGISYTILNQDFIVIASTKEILQEVTPQAQQMIQESGL